MLEIGNLTNRFGNWLQLAALPYDWPHTPYVWKPKMSELVTSARLFAFNAHNAIEQRRKYTGDPYTVHLERVAALVASVVDDEAMIAAAYLHDTVEDTETTLEDISSNFGTEVAYLLTYLTDISRPEDGNRKTRKQLDREHIAKGNEHVHTIKLADLIDNSDSIQTHDPRFAAVYMEEKRLLLEVLADGHPELLARARTIVDAWMRGNSPG